MKCCWSLLPLFRPLLPIFTGSERKGVFKSCIIFSSVFFLTTRFSFLFSYLDSDKGKLNERAPSNLNRSPLLLFGSFQFLIAPLVSHAVHRPAWAPSFIRTSVRYVDDVCAELLKLRHRLLASSAPLPLPSCFTILLVNFVSF